MSNEVMVLGLEEAAKRLDISSGYLRALADKGLLPVLRDSAKRRLFFPSDIECLRQKRESEARKKVLRGIKVNIRLADKLLAQTKKAESIRQNGRKVKAKIKLKLQG